MHQQVRQTAVTLAILKGGRILITDFKMWTQNFLARDTQLRKEAPTSPNAACFCALGAIDRATHEVIQSQVMGQFVPNSNYEVASGGRHAATALFNAAVVLGLLPMGSYGYSTLTDINDGGSTPRQSHTNILAIYDRAIAALEAEFNTQLEAA